MILNDIKVILEFYAQLAAAGIGILVVVYTVEKLIPKAVLVLMERWLWNE